MILKPLSSIIDANVRWDVEDYAKVIEKYTFHTDLFEYVMDSDGIYADIL